LEILPEKIKKLDREITTGRGKKTHPRRDAAALR